MNTNKKCFASFLFIRVHLWPNSWLVVLPFVLGAQQHRGFQVGAGCEAGDALRCDFHGAAATRVANLPGFSVGHSESAEARERDMVAARQTCLYSVEECVQRPRRLRSRQACIDGDFADQVFLVHRAPNARELYQRSDAGVNRRGWAETYGLLYCPIGNQHGPEYSSLDRRSSRAPAGSHRRDAAQKEEKR